MASLKNQFPGTPLQRRTMIMWTDTSTLLHFPCCRGHGLASSNTHNHDPCQHMDKMITVWSAIGEAGIFSDSHSGSLFWFCVDAHCSGKEFMVSLFQRDLSMWLALAPWFGQSMLYRVHLGGYTVSLTPVAQILWTIFLSSYCGVIFVISEISSIANIRVMLLLWNKLARTMPLALSSLPLCLRKCTII